MRCCVEGLFAWFVKSLPAIAPDVLNQQHEHWNKIKPSVVPAVVSPVYSLRPSPSPSLGYSIFCTASRPGLIPTCRPNKLRRNCLSELSACLFFFSPPRTWQETHIYTQKWNYGQFREQELWRQRLLSSRPSRWTPLTLGSISTWNKGWRWRRKPR